MDYNQFEKNLKKELSNLPVDNPELHWENIQRAMKKEKKRNPLIWIFLSSFLLGSVCILMIYPGHKTNSSEDNLEVDSYSPLNKKQTQVNIHDHRSVNNDDILRPALKAGTMRTGISKDLGNDTSSNSDLHYHYEDTDNDEESLQEKTQYLNPPKESVEKSKYELIVLGNKAQRNGIAIDKIPFNTYSFEMPQSSHILLEENLIFPEKPDHKDQKHWQLLISSGYHQQNWSIDADQPQFSDWAALRNKTESSLPGFRSSVKLRYKISSEWAVGAGTQYDQFWTKLESNSTVRDQVLLQNVVLKYLVDDETGIAFDSIIGDTLVNRTRSNTRKIHSKYERLVIPVSLVRSFSKNKWSMHLEAGIDLGVWLRRKGEVLDLDQTLLDIENQNIIHPDKLHFGVHINPALSYQIMENLHLMLSPGYSFSITNWNDDNSGTSLKPRIWNTELGIMIKF